MKATPGFPRTLPPRLASSEWVIQTPETGGTWADSVWTNNLNRYDKAKAKEQLAYARRIAREFNIKNRYRLMQRETFLTVVETIIK